MRNRISRGCLIAGSLPLILALILLIGVTWRLFYAKTEIVTSSSEDGNYSLTIYMIGAPEWPFGATHCRFDLYSNRKRLVKYPFSIQDDGAVAREGNFEVIWNTDSVTLFVFGSEQSDVEYIVYFDGTVEQQIPHLSNS